MNTLKSFAVLFVLFFVLISSTNAHNKLTSPPPRGVSEIADVYRQNPCGGLNEVNVNAITEFPVAKGQATVFIGHGSGFLMFFYADNTGNLPTTNETIFTPVADPILVDAGESHGEGGGKNVTVPVDLTRAGAKAGDQGVLQAQWLSKGNASSQCADIKLVETAGGSSGGASSLVGTFGVTFFIAILVSIFVV